MSCPEPPIDPIFFHAGGPIYSDEDDQAEGWYFWDEVWAHATGPYDSKALAKEAQVAYAESLLSEEDVPL